MLSACGAACNSQFVCVCVYAQWGVFARCELNSQVCVRLSARCVVRVSACRTRAFKQEREHADVVRRQNHSLGCL